MPPSKSDPLLVWDAAQYTCSVSIRTYYFHPDHIGSTSYLTDAAGHVVTRMSYRPYGEKYQPAITGLNIFNKKYTGQVDDSTGNDNGLMYYNARYYDPAIGRFISADTVIPDAINSQAYNRYMYVVGNPVSFNDPTGHWRFKGLWKKFVDKVVGPVTNWCHKYIVQPAKDFGKWIGEHKNDIMDKIVVFGASFAAYWAAYAATFITLPLLISLAGFLCLGPLGAIILVIAATLVIGIAVGALTGVITASLLAYTSNKIFNTNLDIQEYAKKGAISGAIAGFFGGISGGGNATFKEALNFGAEKMTETIVDKTPGLQPGGSPFKGVVIKAEFVKEPWYSSNFAIRSYECLFASGWAWDW